MKQQLRILCPTQHLGFVPFQEKSFWIGAQTHPDYYCCDSGSNPIDPIPLGSDTSVSLYEWQKHDLEILLLTSRKQGVPLIIGSSGDTGTNSRVDLFVDLVKRLAFKHGLAPFKVVYFYSQVAKDVLREKLEQGVKIQGLDKYPPLTLENLEQTERIVAVAEAHPFMKALEMRADVIIGGRSSNIAVFASPVIYEGFSEPLAYSLGRMLTRADFCAESTSMNETVIGTVTNEGVRMTSMFSRQGRPIHAAAGDIWDYWTHPLPESLADGALTMSDDRDELPSDPGTIRTTGALRRASHGKFQVKLEGAGKIGERFVGIVNLKVPDILFHFDTLLESVYQRIEDAYSGKDYQLFWNVYRNCEIVQNQAFLKDLTSSEVCIVLEGIAETEQMAEEITLLASRYITSVHGVEHLFREMPAGQSGFQHVFPAPPAYQRTIHHILVVEQPLELFELHELMIE